MKLLPMLVAAVALLAGCAGDGMFSTSGHGSRGYGGTHPTELRDQNPTNNPANPYPSYGD